MKLKFFSLLAVMLAAAIICGCGSTTAQKVDAETPPPKDPVEEILQSMTLAEKVGQMMITGVHGNAVNDDSRFMFTNYHIGGLIFFDRNLETRAQAKSFAENLDAVAAEKVPLFFAIDEEGGRVARMRHEITPPPSQEEIGSSGDSSQAYRTATSIAQDLKSIGVNLNFAPVADVGTRDTRSFSDNAEVVAEFADAAAKGYEDAGIFYCLKHFPGLGLGKVDTHQDISVVDASRETLETIDFVPFRKIIAAHDNSKFMVMVGHLKYSALDAENPASISPAIVTGILRNELGFTGVIVTDDLDMGAVSKYNDQKTLGVAAVKAGVDIVLSCHDYDKQQKIYLGILEAVERGEISEARIDESVRRILKMKLNLRN